MEFDILLKNCTIIDGTGNPSFKGDAGISGDKIKALGALDSASACELIDLQGAVLAPGFIDIHSHADMSIYDKSHTRFLEPLIRQGITTFVGGNCGISMAPSGKFHPSDVVDYKRVFTARKQEDISYWTDFQTFGDYIEKQGMLLNMALLCPHAILKIDAMGFSLEDSTPEQRKIMKSSLEECLEQGAIGMSCGLQYFPGLQSTTDELIELAKIVKKADGCLALHLRSYTNTVGRAVSEAVEIAIKTGVRIQISHLFWMPDLGTFAPAGKSILSFISSIYHDVGATFPVHLPIKVILSKLHRLQKRGAIEFGVDTMPTSTAFTHLLAFFPPWMMTGRKDEMLDRLKDSRIRQKIAQSIKNGKAKWPHFGDNWSLNVLRMLGWQDIYIMAVASDKNRKYEGISLSKYANEKGRDPLNAICDLLLEEQGQVLVFGTLTDPDDKFMLEFVRAPLLDPSTSISTDTILLGFGKPAQLFYDCYPRYIKEFVFTRRLISLEQAIRKMTSLPAAQAGIRNRGVLKPGYFADFVVFEPENLDTSSTFLDPAHFPSGIKYVSVNGKIVLRPEGYFPTPLSGRFLRKNQ